MLEVNTKVMIKSSRFHRGAHNGQIGTIVQISPNKRKNVFVRINYELGDDIAWLFDDEVVAVSDLEMPIEPVDPEQIKKWTAAARERAGA
jgi:hypothetical protein